MDNDQRNTQQLIPAAATVDFKLSGEYERFFWSLSVNNILNALVLRLCGREAHSRTGKFSAYPLPAVFTW